MRMTAMFVMDVIMIVIVPVVIVTMLMVVMRYMGVRMGMVVVVMVVSMTGMIVVPGQCQRGHRLRRLQRANEPAALGPDQPGTEGRDQGVADDLDHLFGAAHGFG